MRKIIVYIATSADGYIARLDGSVDWLNRERPADNYGLSTFIGSIDTILWGRKTYDEALSSGAGEDGGFGPKVRNYVFTSQPRKGGNRGLEFVNEPVRAFVARLRSAPGKHIWMMGGAGLIASFLDAGEIDEFIIHVMPTFIGEGIPLIAPRHRSIPLVLKSIRRYPNDVARLHYDVLNKGAAAARG
jgi:dihydrofolate reductase